MKHPILLIAFSMIMSMNSVTHATLLSDTIPTLQVGDSIPTEVWNLPLTMINLDNNEDNTIKLDNFKNKLIILDFWATWCNPCIAAFPKMDSLRNQFNDQLVILPITDQPSKLVTDFFANRKLATGWKGFSLLDNGLLTQVFRHHTIPHYVWINKGRIEAITEGKEVNVTNIRQLLQGSKPKLKMKKDETITYNKSLSLLENLKTIQNDDILSTSVWSGFLHGTTGRQTLKRDQDANLIRLTLLNTSLQKMYAIAYRGMGAHLFNLKAFMRFQVKDTTALTTSLSGNDYLRWAEEYTHCYEQQVPIADSAYIFQNLRLLLSTHFPYKATLKKMKIRCFVLKNPKKVSLRTKGANPSFAVDAYHLSLRNQHFVHLLNQLKLAWQFERKPLIDETGIIGNVDLDIHANLKNVEAVREALKKYKLELVERKRRVEMLVITDR